MVATKRLVAVGGVMIVAGVGMLLYSSDWRQTPKPPPTPADTKPVEGVAQADVSSGTDWIQSHNLLMQDGFQITGWDRGGGRPADG